MKNQEPRPGQILIPVHEVTRRLSIGRRTLERLVERLKFPPPIKIGTKSLYLESDVDAYMEKLKNERYHVIK